MLGDGELQEGQIWEGAMAAGHYGLDNLCALIDYNKMQSDDLNENVMTLEPLRQKWEAFNWNVVEVDGHDLPPVLEALGEARQARGRPTVIIAHTIKGQGVSYMAGVPSWHGSVKMREEEFAVAMSDLGVRPEDHDRYRFDG
jgi:transketolase